MLILMDGFDVDLEQGFSASQGIVTYVRTSSIYKARHYTTQDVSLSLRILDV